MNARLRLAFPRTWQAELLSRPPLIAPARQYVYPQRIAGEEDTLARGALQALVHPARSGAFLATFALGFTDPTTPTGVWSCPNQDELCAVAGGYAYVLNTLAPDQATLLEMRPVVEILPLPDSNLLVFAGLHNIAAWGAEGLAWQSARLSWEGLRITGVESGTLRGLGWDLHSDRELEFTIDLASGRHTGGAF